MRRTLAAAALAAAFFATAACGGGDEGGDGGAPDNTAQGTTTAEEVCTGAEQLYETLMADLQGAQQEVLTAAASGDQSAAETAAARLAEVVNEFGAGVRELAASAEDAELRAALEVMAGAVEGLENLDPTDPAALEALSGPEAEAAATTVEEFCGS